MIVVVIANWLNIVLAVIFLNRLFECPEGEHRLGYGTIFMAIPLALLALANLAGRRGWAFWILPPATH